MHRSKRLLLCAFVVTSLAGAANAQSLTGNVGSANIAAGERAAELRLGVGEAGIAQSRAHYEHSLSEWYQFRAIAAFRKPEAEGWDYSGLTLENWLQWSTEGREGKGLNGGLRLAYTFADGGRSDEAAVRLTVTDRLPDGWEWRANLIAGFETSGDPAAGADLESRFQVTRAASRTLMGSEKWRFGAELFSEYGNTLDLQGIDRQAHQFGPVAKVEWGNGVSVQTAVRFGLTEGSDDMMFKLFIGQDF